MIKFCHYVKINSFYNKYNICAFNKDIEGNPFIIRFKTNQKEVKMKAVLGQY